jgi:hypothetical protein
MGTFEGKMAETSSSTTVSTRLERIAKLACSYGFRPGRSAHQALRTVRNQAMEMAGKSAT